MFRFLYAYSKCSCSEEAVTHILLHAPAVGPTACVIYFVCLECSRFDRVIAPFDKMDSYLKSVRFHPLNAFYEQ